MRVLVYCIFITGLVTSNRIEGQLSSKNEHRKANDTCLNILNEYSYYWKKDSLAKNGFRDLFGKTILKNCNCLDVQYKRIEKYLGDPDTIINIGNSKIYRFRLNHLSENLQDLGTFLLDIEINEKGLVIRFKAWEVDG